MGTCFIHDGSQDKAVDEVCDLSSIVGGFKCLFGSHNAFSSHVGDERSSHRGQPHIEVDSIRNEEAAPDLQLQTRKVHPTSHQERGPHT